MASETREQAIEAICRIEHCYEESAAALIHELATDYDLHIIDGSTFRHLTTAPADAVTAEDWRALRRVCEHSNHQWRDKALRIIDRAGTGG